jgi:hypothetical protein
MDLCDLKVKMEAVAWECLGLRNPPLRLTSIGYNPGGRVQAVYEGRVAGHLVQLEIVEVEKDCFHGNVLKPFHPAGPTLEFRPVKTWTYRKRYHG